jgi:hypothetical protein
VVAFAHGILAVPAGAGGRSIIGCERRIIE